MRKADRPWQALHPAIEAALLQWYSRPLERDLRYDMLWLLDKLAGVLSFLCRAFDVPARRLDDGDRTDLPPPEGGISSLRSRR
jgi:hypothetical protein